MVIQITTGPEVNQLRANHLNVNTMKQRVTRLGVVTSKRTVSRHPKDLKKFINKIPELIMVGMQSLAYICGDLEGGKCDAIFLMVRDRFGKL